MLTPNQLHSYQQKAVNFQASLPNTMLWLDMGLGKTAITLTTIAHLKRMGFLRGVIIVAPIRVVRLVWKQEAAKWEHTKHLTFSNVVGTKDQRTRALLRDADIYLINHENLGWLSETLHTYFISKKKSMPFNGLVWDEVSKCKNSTTQRVRSYLKIEDHFDWVTGLTGTPASNGYKDLHGQFLVVDKGQRLGRYKTKFKQQYYYKQGPYKEVPFPNSENEIKARISDITLEMSAEDYNPLPDMIVNNIELEMDGECRAKYERMEKELFLQMDSGNDIELFNQASLQNKCLAEGTEVLTLSGWKRIEVVTSTDKVWDGAEWVSVSGIVCNGYKSVVECWGVQMTPDHKVLTACGWREAQEVLSGEPGYGYDRATVWLPDCSFSRGEPAPSVWVSDCVVESQVRLRERVGGAREKLAESHQEEGREVLWVHAGRVETDSRDDADSTVGNLAQHEITVRKPVRQGLGELWWARGHRVSRMERLRQVLVGYVGRLFGRINTRQDQCERALLQAELSLGNKAGAREQHQVQRSHSDTAWVNDCCGGGESVRPQTDHDLQETREGMVGNGSGQTRVYDIVNAGPRHRFTVRGRNGEVFIAHNCLQFSNGAVYPVAGLPAWEPIHDLKLDALEEIIDEAQGQPIFVAYAYRSDAERIMKKFDHLKPINLTECKSQSSLENAMARWKSGDCPLMIAHPASCGHGIDGLQANGHILVWFGLTWSLDLYDQFNARIRRQGQGRPVMCHRIMVSKTLDQAQALALDEKATTQTDLRNAVKQYRLEKGV